MAWSQPEHWHTGNNGKKMSAPALAVAGNINPISPDNLNTYAQTCNSAAELRNFIGVTGVQVYMRGYISPGDGGQGNFYWNASGVAPDDGGITTIVPTGASSGEWTRLDSINVSSIADGDLLANISGGIAVPTGTTISDFFDYVLGSQQGSIIYRDSTEWNVLTPGTSGYLLQTQGAAANPIWAAASGGTVTTVSVVTANGVSGSVANASTTPAITLVLGDITPSNVSLQTGGALRTDTTTAHTALIQAYDVDGAAYKTFGTLTNANTPSFALAAPSGGSLTIDGAVIGGGTAAAGSFTTISASGQITSTVTTGTAPFVVSSTTQVANLNVATAGSATTATTATNATNTTITDDTTTNATMYPTWVTAATGNLPQKVSSTKMTFNPSTGILTCTGFVGTYNGNTFTTGTGTLTIAAAKVFTVSNTLTLTGTDSTSFAFPAVSSTVVTTGNTASFTKGYSQADYDAGTKSSGTFTPDEANGNLQRCVNGGAFTLAPPSNNTSMMLEITNNGSAGTITTSGFTKVVGDAFTTTNGHIFQAFITKFNGHSSLNVIALQ